MGVNESTTLEEHIFETLRLVNSREKCEFLAFFPEGGTTQKELADQGIFSTNKGVVNYYIGKYTSFIQKQERADAEGYKLMWLTPEGQNLQKVARYMLIMEHNIRKAVKADLDYLNLFFTQGSPKRMVTVLRSLYEDGVARLAHLYRKRGDRNTIEVVNRLEEFGLIKTGLVGVGRQKSRRISTTRSGELYYHMLLKPVIDFFKADHGIREQRVVKNVNLLWRSYLKEREEAKSF